MPDKTKASDSQTADSSKDIVIALNCKLTNDSLMSKKLLSEKNDLLLKMQLENHRKEVECMSLQTLVADQKKRIEELNKQIEQLRAEQYCSDLIELGGEFETVSISTIHKIQKIYRIFILFIRK